MYNRLLPRIAFLLVITTSIVLTEREMPSRTTLRETQQLNHYRLRRAAVRKPGFFRTLFSVIYEQWDDTRKTVGSIRKMVDDNFIDENAPKVETTTSRDPNATTTEAPYKITRTEFNRILQRNLRGLIRLYNIELQDALKQSRKNDVEFRKNASREVSKFL